MRFDILTIFPEIITSFPKIGVIKRADNEVFTTDLRKFANTKYKGVDDRPFGGGDGMVFMPEVIENAMASVKKLENSISIHLTPQGVKFTDRIARDLAQFSQIIFICGRYAGIDERAVKNIDMELSIGDYILSGGELASMVVIEAVTRFQKSVLGNPESSDNDSFSKDSLLEAPLFTRPRAFMGLSTPKELLEGNHEKINLWRKNISILRTFFRTPNQIDPTDLKKAKEFYLNMTDEDKLVCGLPLNADKF